MSGYACACPRLNMALPLSTKTSNIFINNRSFQSMSSKNQTTWRGNRRIQNILNHRAILERMKVVLVAILNKGYTSLVHVILFLFFILFFMLHYYYFYFFLWFMWMKKYFCLRSSRQPTTRWGWSSNSSPKLTCPNYKGVMIWFGIIFSKKLSESVKS